MSNCGYYKIFKGKISCTNPKKNYINSYGKFFHGSAAVRLCEQCKRECKGIYPSDLPKLDLRNECEVVE